MKNSKMLIFQKINLTILTKKFQDILRLLNLTTNLLFFETVNLFTTSLFSINTFQK